MSSARSSNPRCEGCGAPLVYRDGRPCTYCNAAQASAPAPAPSQEAIAAAVQKALREDRDGNGIPDVLDRDGNGVPDAYEAPPPPTPFKPPTPSPATTQKAGPIGCLFVALGACAAMGGTVYFLTTESASPPAPERPRLVAEPVATVAASPPPFQSAAGVSSSKTPATGKPSIAMTNEQWAKAKVAAAQPKLRGCVEQDLLRNPNVPKAYTVSVVVERDGLPRNSATTFVPQPTRGFQSCAGNVIFYGFSGNGPGAPKKEEFTFSTSFAFPTAKPAAKAETGRGWD